MKGIYLYPITGRNNTGVSNPYIERLAEAFSGQFLIVNMNDPSNRGIINVLKYLRCTDILYLNWIEDLPAKYMGYLQSLFFFLLCGYCRITGKKIVWTLHNKRSHSGDHQFLTNLLFRFLLVRSDLVITHAEEGLELVPSRTRKMYIPHPVLPAWSAAPAQEKKAYDIIIWGTIARYKGIDTFLRFLNNAGMLGKFRIMIAGKVVESDLLEYLEHLAGEYMNLKLINRFIPDPELAGMINQTGIILFTYHSESVLSSGALMDSLRYDTNILGPATGAFRDLEREKVIRTYSDYQDLIRQIEQLRAKGYREPFRMARKEKFMNENTWEAFSAKVSPLLDNLSSPTG
jgi:beta-1,4-mannosyltransferase